MATATGLLGACVALATVTSLGRRLPRKAMLAGLAVMPAAFGAGAVIFRSLARWDLLLWSPFFLRWGCAGTTG
ncbi:hypothetical protein [Actinoallomurus rhizosphaericola]|uniref:hypothetical protein n=1 Tax=Actinoallomurus rhizosphaericola TaxID=2952536 RepID=UPI002091921A|nr:hypothetical protein [Actinoallomurus rhizosphaericola]MCO5993204.1 hypothetical protein [Actinoallomurus rhizosphaericola]